jgi:hypothetical protein
MGIQTAGSHNAQLRRIFCQEGLQTQVSNWGQSIWILQENSIYRKCGQRQFGQRN